MANRANKKGDKESIRGVLRTAFPKVTQRTDLAPLTHDECVQMRSRLALLKDDDLPFTLPEILGDLLDTHTGRLGDGEDVEAVIQYLDVSGGVDEFSSLRERYGEEWWTRHVEQEKSLVESRLASFSHFTPAQASAIYAWLNYARDWPELAWYKRQADAASKYWRSRADRPEGAESKIV